jgi:hypothetical protein
MDEVLGHHIIWTTYGTWLHGDARGWVTKKRPGVQDPDPTLEHESRERMAGDAVLLSPEQREIVDRTIRRHCEIRRWTLHALNVRTNHVHVVVTADRLPGEVAEQLKAWCSRKLSDAAGFQTSVARNAGRKRWFT